MKARNQQLQKLALYGAAYNIGPARLAKVLTTPEQKITRKNCEKLLENYAQKWKLNPQSLAPSR